MRDRHIEFETLLDIALEASESDLKPSEREHLNSCKICRQRIDRYRRSFESGFQGDVPLHDIESFRDSFLNAWDQRCVDASFSNRFKKTFLVSLIHSFMKRPVAILVFASFVGCSLSGGRYAMSILKEKTYSGRPVILMDGQRLIHRPELLRLFPEVDRPTLISTDRSDGEKETETFSVHGYLEDDSVQIVWQL